MAEISISGYNFKLLPEKAMIWQEEQCLILSDLHLGKLTHFRKSGMAVPRLAESENYERLSFLLLNHRIERVLILGDLFHSELNSEWSGFKQFLEGFPEIRFELVPGNHDILPEEQYYHKNFQKLSISNNEGPFSFTHHPQKQEQLFNICGHIHPGVSLRGMGKQALRLPCFFITAKQLIMPAFGSFTGLHVMEPREGDRIYVVSDNSILEIS
mgnify:CR=1 FL=1|jgi:DNA ligase-associated metallophosphoesterase